MEDGSGWEIPARTAGVGGESQRCGSPIRGGRVYRRGGTDWWRVARHGELVVVGEEEEIGINKQTEKDDRWAVGCCCPAVRCGRAGGGTGEHVCVWGGG
jgi:hypothetical protein